MPSPRRDAGRARGKPIEQAILAATLAELAAHGLDGLSVARVAAAAEVNKTTVYRRWPTPEALVAAALEAALRETAGQVVDTGTLAGDLRQVLDQVITRLQAPEGRALARAALSDSAGSAVGALAADPLVREQGAILGLIARAVARGEWDPVRHPPDAVLAMLVGSVLHRALLERQPLTASWADVVVDVLVAGLRPGRARL